MKKILLIALGLNSAILFANQSGTILQSKKSEMKMLENQYDELSFNGKDTKLVMDKIIKLNKDIQSIEANIEKERLYKEKTEKDTFEKEMNKKSDEEYSKLLVKESKISILETEERENTKNITEKIYYNDKPFVILD